MIKKFALMLGLMVGAVHAESQIVRFPFEEQLARLYLDVEIQESRIYVQKIVQEYMNWLPIVDVASTTKADAIYITRISDMFASVCLSYQYGV